jgi:hypothetical protein
MRKSVLTRLLVMLLAVMMLAACDSDPKPAETTGAPETTAPESSKAPETQATEPPAEPNGKLYYNIEKGATRAPGMQGMFSINLFCEGVTKSYWFKNEELVKKADTASFFSLGISTTGIVTEVYLLDELKYSMAGENLKVTAVSGTELTAADAAGAAVTLSLAQDAKTYSMVDDTHVARVNDTVTAVQNADKKVIALFIINRAPIMGMCEHCKQEVAWNAWTNTSSLPNESGHFILTEDVSLGAQFQMDGATEIILDLNGHIITNSGGVRGIVMFNPNGYLAIMDSSAEKTGTLVPGTTDVDRGCCLWVREGTVDLYSGTLDASKIVSTDGGVAVDVVGTGVFNMYGGTIIGGQCIPNENGGSGYGGSIRVRGVFNMYGGTIRDGKAAVGGGNVDIAAGATFKMFGGTITGGVGTVNGAQVTGTVEANLSVAGTAIYEKTGGTIEGES